MTIKELADELGVNKEKIKYLYRQLPENMYVTVNGRVILSDAAVDAVKNRLNGGELTSEIPIPPYNAVNPVGWGMSQTGDLAGDFSPSHGECGETIGDDGENSSESEDNSPFTSEFTGETRLKSGDGETGEKTDLALTIFDHYKTMIEARDTQLSVKDEQINALHAQIDKLTTALTERDTAAQEASERQINAARADAAEQLTVKDSQIKRMQDTIDALTRQLEEAERERREAEQSREQPRRWWQWWKR